MSAKEGIAARTCCCPELGRQQGCCILSAADGEWLEHVVSIEVGMLRGHSGVAVIGMAVLRASKKDDASFFIARSSEDLDSLGRESAKDT